LTLIEKGDVLEYGKTKLDYKVLKPSVWTYCLAEYIKTIFTDISEVVKGYTKYTDFYRNNSVISEFISSLKFIESECEFRLDAEKRRVYLSDKGYKADQIKKELFYVIKLGKCFKEIPSAIYFYLSDCFRNKDIPDTYSMALLPETEFSELTSGQLGDPLKIVSSIYGKSFMPLTQDRKYVIHDGIIEFYLAEKNCVVTAPECISSFMPRLSDIRIEKGYVSIDGTALHRYCGKSGVYANNAYDLVNCL